MDSNVSNLCRVEHMSVCTADTTREQGKCSYFEKARHANRCMYFMFDEYCDCLKAQLNAGTPC